MGNGAAVPVTDRNQRRRTFLTQLACAASALALPGCLGRGESKIENGETVTTGRRQYDAYFEKVSELRDSVEKLDSDLFPLRQPLVEELSLDVDVALSVLLAATKERVAKMRDFGVSMTLQLRPTPRVIEDKTGLEADEKQATLIKAVEESANRAMQSYEQYAAMLDEAGALEKQRSDLADRIDKLPPNVDKSLIEREIVGAGVVLRDTEKKLLGNTRTITHFIVGLVSSVDTGATEGYDAKCAEAIALQGDKNKPTPKPKPGWRPPAGPRPAPRPRPAPGPRPAPAPKPGGGDFEM
jgi:hypothetical protein